MSIREKIYDYEEKVSNLKKEINELSSLYLKDSKDDSKILLSKITSMKNELEAINFQLNYLKTSLTKEANDESEVEFVQKFENTSYADLNSKLQPEYVFENDSSKLNTSNNEQGKQSNKNLENTIGKSFMGILASILIFISFILLAMLVYQKITDAVKIFAMYGISLLFVLVGLIKLKKHPKNKLYLSILGCGVGALYISLILSNIYFKVINDIMLYLLIFAWAAFTAYLSRLRSNIFTTIGQIGISIAIIFGTTLCTNENDINKFFTLNIFFVMSAFLFSFSRIYSRNIATNVFNLISLCFMLDTYFVFASNFKNEFLLNVILFILIGFIIYKFFMAYVYSKLSDENIDFALINLAYLGMLVLIISKISSYAVLQISSIVIIIVLLALNEIKFREFSDSVGRKVYQIFLIFWLTACWLNLELLCQYLGVSILAISFIIYGFYKNDKLFKVAGLIEIIILLAYNTYEVSYFILGLITFAVLTYFIIKSKEQYSLKIKNITYILLLIFGLSYIRYWIEVKQMMLLTSFIYCAVMNIIASKSKFKTDFATGVEEEFTTKLTGIINIFLMLFALHMIKSLKDYSAIIQSVIIFVSIALFTLNTSNLIRKYEGLSPGIYIGIKFTVLLLAILNTWETVNFVISIMCILFAMVMIALGFLYKQKSFRIYGLVLVMICTFKLVMIDVTYENSIGQVISFFVSGLLCLGINAMYNILDKKFLNSDHK